MISWGSASIAASLQFSERPHGIRFVSQASAGTACAGRADGCDGGGSPIRKQLGIGLTGEGNLLELRQGLYRCDGLYERIPVGKGRHYHVADAQHTFLIVQDSTKHFTLHGVVAQDSDMVAQFADTIVMPLPSAASSRHVQLILVAPLIVVRSTDTTDVILYRSAY